MDPMAGVSFVAAFALVALLSIAFPL